MREAMLMLLELSGGRRRLPLLGSLVLSVLLSVSLVLLRILHSHRLSYGFLLWNLVLALVPLVAITLARLADQRRQGSLRWMLLGLWLLFLPNAPYLVTDLLHLHKTPGVPLWFDVALLFSCAWNGLILGMVALYEAQELVTKWSGRLAGWTLAALAVGLSGFGIYLGRYLRWNSWDLLSRPLQLLTDIAARVVDPIAYPRTWLVTVTFALLFGTAYLAFRSFTGLDERDTEA